MPVGLYAGANVSIGNGATLAFPYNFKILDQTHLEVKVDGALKVLGADYTVTGVGLSNGGNVNFIAAPANGSVVQRARKVPIKRDQDYQNNGDFKEITVDNDFDSIEMQVQQIAADVARAFKAPLSVTADQVFTDADWAARAGKFVRYKNDGSNIEFVSASPDLSTFTATGVGAVPRSWSSKVGTILDVEDFGAVGDGVTDDTAAIQRAAAALSLLGGGTLRFGQAKTYKIWTATYTTLISLANLRNVIIEGNGSRLVSGQVNAALNVSTALATFAISASNCKGLTVKDLELTGGNTTLTAATGEGFVELRAGTQNVALRHLAVYNCFAGLICEWGTSPVPGSGYARVRGVSIDGFYIEKTYYGIEFKLTGDDVIARKVVGRNTGRVYFAMNVKNHDISIDDQHGGPFTPCLLKVYAVETLTAEENTLQNIRLNYWTTGRYAGAGNALAEEALVAFDLEQHFANVGSAAASVLDVDVTINATALNAAKPANLLIFRRYNKVQLPDNTVRNHVVKRIRLGGTVKDWNFAIEDGVRLFSVQGGQSWAGDTINGIVLRDLNIAGVPPAGSSIYVNGQGFIDTTQSLVIDNVVVDGVITYANIGTSRIREAGFKSSNQNNLDHRPTAWVPAWASTGVQPAIGNGVLGGVYSRAGQMVDVTGYITMGGTTTYGTGEYTFSLPYASANDGAGAIGSVYALRSGVAYRIGSCFVASNSSVVSILFDNGATTMSGAVPHAWAVNDFMKFSIRYRT